MILFRTVWWLVSLPVRLLLWAVGLTLWLLLLPLRLVFGVVGFIGLGRLAQLGVLASIGYFAYRLVNGPASPDESRPADS
jgi:hypothetical protein